MSAEPDESVSLEDEDEFVAGRDFYTDENGLMVLTRHYLLKRGRCCCNGCRNCPYGGIGPNLE